MKPPHLLPSLVVLVTALAHTSAFAGLAEDTAAAIRAEALRPNMAADGRPLPLWSAWGSETAKQIQFVEQGHYAIPMFYNDMVRATAGPEVKAFHDRFGPIKRAKELGLPIGFVTIGDPNSAHEAMLRHPPFSVLPPEKSALAYDSKGQIIKGAPLSPFGAIEPWNELGRKWAGCLQMRILQEWYPNPPLVVFLSNNEVGGLHWKRIGEDFRCPPKARNTKDDDLKRQVTGDGWIERFRALQGAWKAGLTEPWRKAARFIGYEATAPYFMGRSWGLVQNYSLISKGRVAPWPLAWDGGSPSYYSMHGVHGRMPDGVWSPMVEFQSFNYLVPAMHRLNPDFWHEMSIWDGVFTESIDASGKDSRERFYAAAGLTYTPQHLAGYAQFGMWLTRPRIARDFGLDPRPPFMQALVESVSRVHRDPALREWWRKGELVPNKAREYPFKFDFPKEFEKEDRWFILDTDLDPPEPWTYGHDDPGATTSKFTRFAVFSIALTRGGGGARQWLVYTFAPMTERKGVKIKIPGYGRQITVDAPVQGAFYEVDERADTVKFLPPPENLPMLQAPGTITVAPTTPASDTAPAGPARDLFNGRDAAGWSGPGGAPAANSWQVAGTTFTAKGKSTLWSEESFADYEFEVEWKVGPGGNGGVFYHVNGASELTAPEMQLTDPASAGATPTGGVYRALAPARDASKPVGEWNTAKLVVRGPRREHWINGEQACVYDAIRLPNLPGRDATSGRIVLQANGSEVSYRNAKVRVLGIPATAATAPALEPDATFLSDLPEENPVVGLGSFGKNGQMGYMDLSILVNGKPSPKGLSTHAVTKGQASVRYSLGGQYARFKTEAALHDRTIGKFKLSLTFLIKGDGRELWRSPEVRAAGATYAADVSVAGVQRLELIVDCPGETAWAQTVWVEPRLFKTAAEPAVATPATALPAPPADPQLAALHAAWTARFEAEAEQPFEAALAALNAAYLRALDNARAAAKNNGALAEVLAVDAEIQQIQTTAAPGADAAAATPPALALLRKTWHETRSRHAAEREAKLTQLRAQYARAIDALVVDLTKANQIEEAKRAQAFRESLPGQKPAP